MQEQCEAKKERYSVPEVAEMLHIPISTLTWRIRNKKIIATQDPFSRRYSVSSEEVERIRAIQAEYH